MSDLRPEDTARVRELRSLADDVRRIRDRTDALGEAGKADRANSLAAFIDREADEWIASARERRARARARDRWRLPSA